MFHDNQTAYICISIAIVFELQYFLFTFVDLHLFQVQFVFELQHFLSTFAFKVHFVLYTF